jgi:hypothetical protein
MSDVDRLKEMVNELCDKIAQIDLRTPANRRLTTDQAHDMLVLSESISALLTSFLFKQKVIYRP